MVAPRNPPSPPAWISAAAKKVDLGGDTVFDERENMSNYQPPPRGLPDFNLSLPERAVAAGGAAVISAVIVNPLDVAKTRLQAQATGVPYPNQCGPACFGTDPMLPHLKSSTSWNHGVLDGQPRCSPECSRYNGTWDVFFKVVRQEGLSRLWRGTNASLALAVPSVAIYMPCYDIFRNYMETFTEMNTPNVTPYVPLVAGSVARTLACVTCYPVELARTRMQAFRESGTAVKPPGVWKTLIGVVSPVGSVNHLQKLQNYRVLWTGLGAQLARDVPFSAICWGTLEPIRRRILRMAGEEAKVGSVLCSNFCAGFIAGSLAAAATCPLDFARTRRQIEKDPSRQRTMTTWKTLQEIWREGGWKGLFTGISPRVSRAGPSVGIVVSSYEVVKYALHHRRLNDLK